MGLNVHGSFPERFYNHFRLGIDSKVKKNISKEMDYKHLPNWVEKAGNGILWVVGSLPRAVKWVGRQCQDPRVVTVALTASALLLASLAFYPAATTSAVRCTFTAIRMLAAKIPLWSVRLAAYIVTCSTIIGFGARAAGRFGNAALMKAFYGLPQSHQGNPANMTIGEIQRALRAAPERVVA